MKLIKDYKTNDQYRYSFTTLAKQIFGLDIKSWYEKGFWQDRYIPYSFVESGQVIANVSVNLLDLMIEGKTYKAIQIGTVMTHPDYRGKGLSSQLMQYVLEEYAGTYDYMYLFANESVLDFYPKFGFKRVEEYQFSTTKGNRSYQNKYLQKLDVKHKKDLEKVYDMVKNRVPVSNSFATLQTDSLTMFHCLNGFQDHLYYILEEDAIVMFEKRGTVLHVYDIICKKAFHLEQLLEKVTDDQTDKICLYFTPEQSQLYEESIYKRNGALFVKEENGLSFPSKRMHPITSEA